MATAERTVYVCDQCGEEEDEELVANGERWIQVKVHGDYMQLCGDCWSFL